MVSEAEISKLFFKSALSFFDGQYTYNIITPGKICIKVSPKPKYKQFILDLNKELHSLIGIRTIVTILIGIILHQTGEPKHTIEHNPDSITHQQYQVLNEHLQMCQIFNTDFVYF